MNKELKALEVSKQLKDFVFELELGNVDKLFVRGSFDIIETAIERLQKLDEIFKKYDLDDIWLEPALYVIKKHFPMNTETQLKKLKALDIIKEKVIPYSVVNRDMIKRAFDEGWITQEEYDLLTEVLK